MHGGDGEDLFIAGRDAEIIDGDVRYENYRGSQLSGGPGSHAQFASDALNDDAVSYLGSSAGIEIVFNLIFTDYVFTQYLGGGFAQTIIPPHLAPAPGREQDCFDGQGAAAPKRPWRVFQARWDCGTAPRT